MVRADRLVPPHLPSAGGLTGSSAIQTFRRSLYMIQKAYHITQWEQLYETAETRKIRTLTYYAKPNKLVGEGIGFTLSQPNGPHLLGMWALLEALASLSAQDWRGWLVRNGSALDAGRMASLTRVPTEHFVEALDFFCRPEVSWLELIDWPGQSPGKKPAGSNSRDNSGGSSGQSPGKKPDDEKSRENAGPISLRGKTDKRGKTEGTREREENGGFATQEEARRAQQTQFAALRNQISELERIPEEDRSEEHEEDLKKKRRTLKALQKKQAAGDFTPLREDES